MTEKECFICCSKSGKTTQEKMLDNIHYKRLRYPLIPLSYAYGCNCKTMMAHNRCLFGIFKCPTCRKNVYEPRLCVKGNIENYLYLEWIKYNPTNFEKMQKIALLIAIIIIILVQLNERKYINITNNYILLGLTLICMLSGIVLFIGDYIEKFWLFKVNGHFYKL